MSGEKVNKASIIGPIPGKLAFAAAMFLPSQVLNLSLSTKNSRQTYWVKVIITETKITPGTSKNSFTFKGRVVEIEKNTDNLRSLGLPEQMKFKGSVNLVNNTGELSVIDPE